MNNRNITGIATTGSGKTLAYSLLPMVDIMNSNNNIKILILAPTRELAIQNYDVCKELGDLINIKCGCI